MEKKFQVFVSSTYTDLIDERQDTLKSILDLSHIPAGMEGFFAADEEQLKYIKRIIDQCDFYVLIIGGRYGSVDESGVSYTELECDYAVSKGLTVLAFVHEDISTLPADKVDIAPSTIDRLDAFKEKVCQRRLVSFWRNREQLKSNIIISLSKAIRESDAIGWVRGDAVASADILAQLNQYRDEVDRLKAENDQLSGQLRPRLEGIAPLSDLFKISYYYYDDRSKRTRELLLSWAAIFKIIGPSFFSPGQKIGIDHAVQNYARETEHLPAYTTVNIPVSAIETIKLQMVGYGFMNVFSAGTTQGGMAEFIQLTDAGKRALIELTAVRSP